MRKVILILSLLLVAAAAGAQPLQVALEVSPATTLPGIPVSFRLTFTNGGAKAVAVPKQAFLLVTPSHGDRFLALWDGTTPIATLAGDDAVGKNGSVVRELATDGTMLRPRWFVDGRLAQPGTYQLQMYVANGLTHDDDAQTMMDRATAVSNRAVLTVAEPKGAEAAIWSAMLAVGEGRWDPTMLFRPAGRELAQRIVKEQPESPYAGWFAAMGTAPTAEEKAETLRSWLARHPNDPHAEWRMLRVADWEVSLADKYAITKPAKANDHDRKAREALDKLKNARSAEVRARVKERLEYLAEPGV
jgi:hypothetical protein